MSWLIAIIVGAIVGIIASAIMRTRQNYLLDIVFGIVGALLARWIFGAVLGIGSAAAAGTLSFWGIVWGVIGAVILIAIVRAVMTSYYSMEQPGTSYHEEVRKRRDKDDNDMNH